MSSDPNNPPQAPQPETPQARFSFAVLAQNGVDVCEDDIEFQLRQQTHWSARKACAALKVTSAIINAIVIHPGGESDDATLAETTRELMSRAAALTDSATELMGLAPGSSHYAGYRNLLRQQAAEVVANQWRMAHGTKTRELSVEQIASMYKVVLDHSAINKEGEPLLAATDVDFVAAKRLAILGVVPEIYNAVNTFDYFAPEAETLVDKGVQNVMAFADEGVNRIAGSGVAPETMTMLTQSLLSKAGALYAANYRAQARKDVLALQRMSQIERKRYIHAYRETGLPTGHIDTSFSKLMRRMVDMVCEAVPELQRPQPPEAQAAPVTTVRNGNGNSAKGNHHDAQPE